MSFSTPVFLFLFFPLTILGYYLIHPKLKNAFLTIASLAFYAWGEPRFIVVFAATILFNYLAGVLLGRIKELKNTKRLVMIAALAVNIGLLFYYKYLMFGTEIINDIFKAGLTVKEIALPLGISFFTFRSISYILDVYWCTSEAQKNPVNVALYISFFPQVSMGPITKSNVFLSQINNRHFDLDIFTDGIKRFIVGMAKKLIIADTLSVIVDPVFSMAADERTVVAAWYGIIGYCLQLYFDFSGYSDMAIGLGKMFGFETPENFDYPYMSKGAVEYWNRWHITLGAWLKDYLYTPVFRSLYNKKKPVFLCDVLGLIAVWLVAGIWHGAAWHYVMYGLYYCTFIILERTIEYYEKKKRKKLKQKKKPETKWHAALSHIYFIFVLIFGQLLFRIDNLGDFFPYVGNMFGANVFTDSYSTFTLKSMLGIFVLGILFCFPVAKKVREILQKQKGLYVFADKVLMTAVYVGMFLICVAYMQISTYNPFLYNNF